MPVSVMAMEEAWNALVIRKAIRKQYEDEDEIDPVELGDYGLYDTEAEQPEDEDERETPWLSSEGRSLGFCLIISSSSIG